MKPEERANELYPNNSTFCGGVAQIARDAFIKGARLQKEADTLRWQDIKTIVEIDHELLGTDTDGLQSEEAYYTEILRRYNKKHDGQPD